MLNRIIRFSLTNRLIVLVGAILLMFWGSYTATNMEVDVFPDLNAPTVVVMTEAGGMAAEEVEKLVTFPVETAVNGATGVRRVRSSSTTGFSIVWVEFDWGTDIYRDRQIVSEKLAAVLALLPDGIGAPTLGPQSSILGELMIVSLTSDSVSGRDLRTIADWTIRPRLLATGGVAQVAVIGGEVKEFQIALDNERMKHYNVSLDQVLSAANGMNRNSTGGVIYEWGNEYIIRNVFSTSDVELLGQALVVSVDGVAVTLADVATVRVGDKTPKMGVASERGRDAVIVTITKQPNTSTIELTEKIDKTIAEIGASLPTSIHISTDIFRQSRFIDASISNIQRALIEGGIFVVIVLFFFLMNVRTTLISLVTIPLSLLVSIIVLKFMGMTINTMSLGGMAIAIGSLVDDAIVDVENVFKRLRENSALPRADRRGLIEVVFDASKEVRMPILNSTLIIVASFVPLFFLSGMEGRMLAPLGVAFIVALFASTLVALTLTPVLCSYLLANKKQEDRISKEPYVARHLKVWYEKVLSWTLVNKKIVLSATGVVLLATIAIFFTLGRSFLPAFNEGSLTINVSTLPGISLAESDNIGRRAEQLLLTVDEIETVARKTGRAELDEHALGVNVSEIEAPFTLGDRTKDEMVAEVRAKLNTLSGVNIEIGQPISHRIDAMLSGTRANIAIKLFGDDLNRLYNVGNQIKDAITNVEGIADLNVEQQIERAQLKIEPRRQMLIQYGITLPQFNTIVATMLDGQSVGEVYQGNERYELVVKGNDNARSSIADIASMTVDAGGVKIPLENIATITSGAGPGTISRENVSRKIVVSANVAGRDLRGVVDDIRNNIETKVTLPEGYHIEYGGQFESEQAASRTLMVTSIFSILVIFLLLFNQFRSVSQSVVVLLNLPLALIGGVFIIFFTSGEISIPAIIGFISLFGIATRNGMLLISRYNDLCDSGMSVYQSVITGSVDRLNPILMTALTSALALIPIVFNGSMPGNELQSPMAQVLLGGLLSSTLLNGFIIPIMYIIINGKRDEKVSI